jgi:hypothetical protein
MTQAGDRITLDLDRSVALVVFDFLARTSDEHDGEPLGDALEHPAELPALWALLSALDEVLPEAFERDYPRRVDQARQWVTTHLGNGAG